MRLLLEAATHMMTRSRLSRRIVRRPYYPEARRFFELIAPTYEVEVDAFDRFLAEARDHQPRHRRPVSAIAPTAVATDAVTIGSISRDTTMPAPGRRRRRRRGGRRRRGPDVSATVASGEEASPADESILSSAVVSSEESSQGNNSITDDSALDSAAPNTITSSR
jgi:hypothetical protein